MSRAVEGEVAVDEPHLTDDHDDEQDLASQHGQRETIGSHAEPGKHRRQRQYDEQPERGATNEVGALEAVHHDREQTLGVRHGKAEQQQEEDAVGTAVPASGQ